MSRTDELKNIFKDVDEGKRVIVSRLIDEAVYLEERLTELKQYPQIRIHPTNPSLQKITAAGKQYRELLQTYVNLMDKLCKYYGSDEIEEDSPLRAFMKKVEQGV